MIYICAIEIKSIGEKTRSIRRNPPPLLHKMKLPSVFMMQKVFLLSME